MRILCLFLRVLRLRPLKADLRGILAGLGFRLDLLDLVGLRLLDVGLLEHVGVGVACLTDVFVDHRDLQTRHQEARLTHTVDQLFVVEFRGVIEDFRIRPITDARARALRRHLADDLELGGAVLARFLER